MTDERGGPPDFIGVGAQRSGTTWFFKLLLLHPSIRGPVAHDPTEFGWKELHFFDHLHGAELTADAWAKYCLHFPPTPSIIRGEWTPRYMFDFWVPKLIYRVAPQARLLVLLRDPIQRFVSGLKLTPQVEINWSLMQEHEARCRYAAQLRRLLRYFPRERLLVLQYERVRVDPRGHLRRAFEFLGVDPFDVPTRFITEPVNTRPNSGTISLLPEVREALVDSLRDDVADLATLYPELDLSLWPEFG